MDEESPNLPVGCQKQSEEEAIVHHAVAMNVEEAGTQEAHSHKQKLVAIQKLEGRSRCPRCHRRSGHSGGGHAGGGRGGREMEYDHHDDDDFPLERVLFPLRRGLPGNVTLAVAPHDAEAGQGANPFYGFFADEHYMDYIDNILVQAERDEARRPRTVPLETRSQAPALTRPIAPANDPVKSTRQALFTSADSQVVFAGMAEGDDNGWYESIVRDAQMMEQMEDPGLDGMPSPLHLPGSEAPKEEPGNHRPSAEEASPVLTLQHIGKIWGLHPSELGPDEPGPSTRRPPRVGPLADDEVAKFDCGICLGTVPILDLFHGMPCPHKFCARCMHRYIEGRTRAGEVPIPCLDPACKEEGNGVLHPEDSKKSIDFGTFCSWSNKLTENAILPNQRVYCPSRECRVMLESSCANKTPSKASCPACDRLMCTACGLNWSTDGSGQHDCGEGPEAVLVKQLATERQWKQCPRCRMFVERTTGCDVMTCRY